MNRFLQRISSDNNRLLYELRQIGVDDYALGMAGKGETVNIKIKHLTPPQANILKQEALASGMDAAVGRGTVSCSVKYTDALLMGNKLQYLRLLEKLRLQPYSLAYIAKDIENFLEYERGENLILSTGSLRLSEPVLMSILNITPDSFSDGGKFLDSKRYKEWIDFTKESGVNVIDIGGESTRPGSKSVSASEEIDRISDAVSYALKNDFVVSVDTYKHKVAEKMLAKGAHIINDISGFHFDSDMPKVCSDYNAAVCLMHTSDTPDKMQKKTDYENILEEIKRSLFSSVEKALKAGIKAESIIIDPGFGFGKTLNDNYIMLKFLKEFKEMGFPLMIGVSRKSMINKVTNQPPDESILGSKIIEAISIANGADIIRTHDLKEGLQMLSLMKEYRKVQINE